MAKYMLIMRNSGSVQSFEDMDFDAVITAMGKYNESMIEAGVLLAGDGLSDAAQGAVVEFTGEAPIVTDGPYGEAHELFNGFWTIQAATKEEAVEWAKRAPLTQGNKIEVRRVTDESDFAAHELFNGFWTIQAATKEEAVEWAKRAPLTKGNKIEVRRVTDETDFAGHEDNEYLQKEQGWREEEEARRLAR